MTARTSALLLVVALAGCQWEGRPDGAEATHSASDGFYEAEGQPQATPLGGTPDGAEITEPLDPAAFGTYRGTPPSQPTPVPEPVPAADAE